MLIKKYLFLALCALLLCTACGKRPDTVDAPDGTDPRAYPRTYPDISTDPVPTKTDAIKNQ
jgi:hypothetical protein